MKNIFLGAIMAATIVGGFSSCTGELDALPTQMKVDGNVVVDQRSAQQLLNGMYYKFAHCGEDYYGVNSTDFCSYGNAYPADFVGVIEYYQGPYMLELHGLGGYQGMMDFFWGRNYQILPACNSAISQINDASDSWFTTRTKKEMMGEAYGMRALVNSNLLRYFGYSWDVTSPYGIVLRVEPITSSTTDAPRATVAETYDAIFSDLDYAIANAPATNPNYYMTSWAAKGLKARVLMMRHQNADLDEVIKLTTDIIGNGPFTIAPMIETVHQKGLSSSDVMLGIQPFANQTDVYEAYYYRGEDQFYPTENFINFFDDADPRKEVLLPAETVSQIVIDWGPDGSFIGYHFEDMKKYTIRKNITPGLSAATTLSESQYLMRLTEMYLLRAEAYARKNELGKAMADLNAVLTTNGCASIDADTQHEALRQIFREAIRNLSCENGLEEDYMLRFPADIIAELSNQYGSEMADYRVFPIPTLEFQNNPLIKGKQNPGYSEDQTQR